MLFAQFELFLNLFGLKSLLTTSDIVGQVTDFRLLEFIFNERLDFLQLLYSFGTGIFQSNLALAVPFGEHVCYLHEACAIILALVDVSRPLLRLQW